MTAIVRSVSPSTRHFDDAELRQVSQRRHLAGVPEDAARLSDRRVMSPRSSVRRRHLRYGQSARRSVNRFKRGIPLPNWKEWWASSSRRYVDSRE